MASICLQRRFCRGQKEVAFFFVRFFFQSGKTIWKHEAEKPISTALEFALDLKPSAALIEGFVKLHHLCQISDTPRHTDCN